MIIKRLYSSQEVVEGLHLVWDVFIRENANSCTQQGIEEFARFIKMENFMPLVESGEMIVFGAVEGQDLGGVGAVRRDGHFPFCLSTRICGEKGLRRLLLVKCAILYDAVCSDAYDGQCIGCEYGSLSPYGIPGSGTGSEKERDPFCSDGFDDITGKCKIFL